MRRLTWFGLVGMLMLLLSGCFKLDMDLEVKDDDTVDGTMIVAMEKSVAEMFGAMGGEGGELDMSEMFDTGDLPEGASAEDYDEDGFVGQRVTFEGVSLEEFAETTESEDGTGDLSIERDGDVFRVAGTFDMTMSEEEGGEFFDAEEMLQDAEIRIQMTFPGEVTEANGEVDGSTVTWTPQAGEATEISAVAEAEGGAGGSGWVIGLVVGLVVLAAAAVAALLLVRRRRAPAGTAPADPAPPAPAPSDTTPQV